MLQIPLVTAISTVAALQPRNHGHFPAGTLEKTVLVGSWPGHRVCLVSLGGVWDNGRFRIQPGIFMAIVFAVRGDHIQLDQLLKAASLVSSGGEAHAAVEAGDVRVDGQVESRKRAKLRPGQKVSFAGEEIELVAET